MTRWGVLVGYQSMNGSCESTMGERDMLRIGRWDRVALIWKILFKCLGVGG
ncbi:hypothetical protein RSSM_01784, partial [Rhodopirellula sallentina SM41]